MKILIITTSVLLLHSAFAEQLPVPNWKMLESMDSNKNDLISRDEFLSSNKVFNFIDQNKDQQLSEKELDIARKSTPAAPKVGEKAPVLHAFNPDNEEIVSLSDRPRPFALIFGTHT